MGHHIDWDAERRRVQAVIEAAAKKGMIDFDTYQRLMDRSWDIDSLLSISQQVKNDILKEIKCSQF